MEFLLFWPVWLSLCFILAVSLVLTTLLLAFIRRAFKKEHLETHQDFHVFVFNSFGLIFAVVLGFVIVGTWENYDHAISESSKESATFSLLYRDAEGFSSPTKEVLQEKVKNVILAIYSEGWQADTFRKPNPKVVKSTHELWEGILELSPTSAKEQSLQNTLLNELNTLWETRRNRILAGQVSIPPLMWGMLFVGAFLFIAGSFCFHVPHPAFHFVIGYIFTVFVGLLLYLIYILDHPFTGVNALSPSLFELDISAIFK